jgi:hypothetical protein
VEVGSAKTGEGAAHRRVGEEKQLQGKFDDKITTGYELFKYVVLGTEMNDVIYDRRSSATILRQNLQYNLDLHCYNAS